MTLRKFHSSRVLDNQKEFEETCRQNTSSRLRRFRSSYLAILCDSTSLHTGIELTFPPKSIAPVEEKKRWQVIPELIPSCPSYHEQDESGINGMTVCHLVSYFMARGRADI